MLVFLDLEVINHFLQEGAICLLTATSEFVFLPFYSGVTNCCWLLNLKKEKKKKPMGLFSKILLACHTSMHLALWLFL